MSSTAATATKRKTGDEPGAVEKKQKSENQPSSVGDYIIHFRTALLPNYNPKNHNHVARMIDLVSGDMRHCENIVMSKLRMTVDVNPNKDSLIKFFIKVVNDLSNDPKMSVVSAVGPVLWPKCGLTGNYLDGKFGGKTLATSKYKFGQSAASWSSIDRDGNGQSVCGMASMKFIVEFTKWVHEQLWEHPLLSQDTKTLARDAALEAWKSKNETLVECGKPPLPFTEDLVKDVWFKKHARGTTRLMVEKETKKQIPNTEYVTYERKVLRSLTKKEKELKKTRTTPYEGPSQLFTDAYYNDDKIEDPILFKDYKGDDIPREKTLQRPLTHADVGMVQWEPSIFESSPKHTAGVTMVPGVVWMIQYAPTHAVRPSNVKFEDGQEFPVASTAAAPASTSAPTPTLTYPEEEAEEEDEGMNDYDHINISHADS